MKDKDGGWDISEYEMQEDSLVSVPSNTDAVVTAYSRQKLRTPEFKNWARSYYDLRTPQSGRAKNLRPAS